MVGCTQHILTFFYFAKQLYFFDSVCILLLENFQICCRLGFPSKGVAEQLIRGQFINFSNVYLLLVYFSYNNKFFKGTVFAISAPKNSQKRGALNYIFATQLEIFQRKGGPLNGQLQYICYVQNKQNYQCVKQFVFLFAGYILQLGFAQLMIQQIIIVIKKIDSKEFRERSVDAKILCQQVYMEC
eukprot:TRINITY_DN9926_c0_g3_i3.p3 TRINITY_DN9926_c0_g3~~TRINITY_DN9926_c0_g3_i3.p3  ORF type:complete len:185 (-),score=9.49 TRINITY_DN9926_c0_g3_i3:133-687(-)